MARDEPPGDETVVTSGDRDGTVGSGGGDLRMPPDQMLDLARGAAELLVERNENLPAGDAWDGEFREGLAAVLALHSQPLDGLGRCA